MVTESMDGGDVERIIEEASGHILPLDQTAKIAQETCRGLEFAHSRDTVHRDLKPGNVWLTADGISKIGDFVVALDAIDLAISGEVPAIPDDEAHSLDRLVGEPFVYVRNAERDSNDPADLSVSRSLLGQIIIAAWDEDLYKSSGD